MNFQEGQIPRKAIGHSSMSLQLSSTSPGFEIRTSITHPSHESRAGKTTVYIPRYVHLPFRYDLDEGNGRNLEKKVKFCGNHIPNSQLMTEAPTPFLIRAFPNRPDVYVS
jgi:hypothetical protein